MKLTLITSYIAPLFVLTLAGQAWAVVECETDADCIDGFVCEEVGGVACAMPDCPDGDECPEPPDCEEEVFYACVPGPCGSDDDCAEGMRCVEVEFGGDCAVSSEPCPEGEDCPPPDFEDYDCDDVVTESYCLPSWIGTCESDSECGEGFECVPDEICMCSGGGGIDDPPPPDPEDPDSDPYPEEDPDCTCEPTDESYCRPREIECEEDVECPDGWTCEDLGTAVSVTCYIDESGEEICEEPDPEPVDESGFCMPPYFDEMGWDAGGDADVDGDTLEYATGHDDSRPTGRSGGQNVNGSGPSGGANGCQAAPGASGATAALFWMLPLLIGLARKRS